jgi:heme/copper-type cytochrome/quinol oxidase subunit 3
LRNDACAHICEVMETMNINWLGLVSLLLVAVLVAPAAIRMNRGRQWLPRAAVWLAVLVGLIFVYQTFGPF